MLKMFEINGVSLVEMLIALSVICILMLAGIPSYSNFLIRTYRFEATNGLITLAMKLEQYYTLNHTYKNATLTQLNFADSSRHYHFSIATLSKDAFKIEAIPFSNNDVECGKFILLSSGKKEINGAGKKSNCW